MHSYSMFKWRSTRWVGVAVTACAVSACDPALDADPLDEAEIGVHTSALGPAKWLTVGGLSLFNAGTVPGGAAGGTFVPVAAANLPNGKVLLWSTNDPLAFDKDLNGGSTYTTIFDPAAPTQTPTVTVTNTRHDMFCPGTTNLADGRILVNGGKDGPLTSIYNPANNTWSDGGDMAIGRGYQGNTLLADGTVLTLGGSWKAGVTSNDETDDAQTKDAELWSPSTSTWRRLPNLVLDSSFDAAGRVATNRDNHMWLFPMSNGRILHAGPSVQMHWLDVAGDGSVEAAGPRGNDTSSLNGSVVMYDIDKILKLGGAEDYGTDPDTEVKKSRTPKPASPTAYVIKLVGSQIQVTQTGTMQMARTLANAVVLPTGQVVVLGGLTQARLFSDDPRVMAPEIWDPATGTFSVLPVQQKPRAYHSFALLLPDGRVMVGGGGLSKTFTDANHPDLEILEPPYLYNDDGSHATRPLLNTAPATASHGTTIRVTTGGAVDSFALVRASSVTHSINNDQRRIPLTKHLVSANTYDLDIPANKNVVLPGNYMLFAMNAPPARTPSFSKTITIGAATSLPAPAPSPNVYVWRFYNSTAVPGGNATAAYHYMTTTATPPVAPTPPAGYVLDPTANGFIFQAWSMAGTDRVPISLCRNGTASHWLGNGCAGDTIVNSTLFYAYAQARPNTTKVLHYLSTFGGKLIIPFSGPNKKQIDDLDLAPTSWTAWINRNPVNVSVLTPFYVSMEAIPDRLLWRFYGRLVDEDGKQIHQSEVENYAYSTTGTTAVPGAPQTFQLDPTINNAHVARVWSTPGTGRIPIYHCVGDWGDPAPTNGFHKNWNWLGNSCSGNETVGQVMQELGRPLFYASSTSFTNGAKMHHYLANIPLGGKLLIPAHAGTQGQINGLDTSPSYWTPYVNASVNLLTPAPVFWVNKP